MQKRLFADDLATGAKKAKATARMSADWIALRAYPRHLRLQRPRYLGHDAQARQGILRIDGDWLVAA